MSLPDKVDDLIELLDKRAFPLKNLPATADGATVSRHFGARDVVDFLRALQRERDEGLLDRTGFLSLGDDD